MAEFVFLATHEVYYSTRDPVPVADVIESLLGLERLIKMTPRALEGLTGVPVDKIEVFVDHLESGSLFERVLIKLFFKDENELDAFLDKVRAKVGDGPARNVLIGAVIASLLYYGAQLVTSAQGGNTTNITANNNTIINIGAGEVQMTPEAFKAIVEAAVTDKKDLAKSSVQILKPARNDPNASITLDDSADLVVPPEVVKDVPASASLGANERVEDMPDAELLIRATNRDSVKTGWSARLPLRFEGRIKLKLADGIDPEEVAGMARVRGDIKIHYRLDPSRNQYVPDFILLLNVK